MNKVTLEFITPLSEAEIEKILKDSAKKILTERPISKKMHFIPHVVKLSNILKSKEDIMRIEKVFLNKEMDKCVKVAKNMTPITTGYLRKRILERTAELIR
jgi:hypothetical protein